MKKLIIFITLLAFTPMYINAEGNFKNESNTSVSSFNIENGWYTAIVNYSNYSRGIEGEYRFNVKVEFNIVTTIDIGIGNYLHSGINHSGYFYYGGFLSFEKDENNNVIAASTTVIITEKNGNVITCDIRI